LWPVVVYALARVLIRVELGAFRWQRDDGDVGRYDEACRHVPAGLVDQKDSVGGGFNGCGDLREVQVHRFGFAGRQDQGCALAPLRAYRTEDVGGGGTLVTRCAWAGAALRPATGDLVLLADASLVGEPDFYRVAVGPLRAPDFFQRHGERFLNPRSLCVRKTQTRTYW